MAGTSIREHFDWQAGWNDWLGSPFTAALCRSMGEDFDAGGPVYALFKDHSGNANKDASSLRLAGALHHAVLTGAAPELAAVYPAAMPKWNIGEVWPLARAYLEANLDLVAAFIESPPQTNETRRSIALLPGFLALAARHDMPMDLLELGASAGLNQNWDRYGYETASWARLGTSDVLIKTDWTGPAPAHLDAQPHIRSRAACDLNPLDVSDPAEALNLKCYTWADQDERLTRLDAAMKLAVETGVNVEQADAADWLEDKLAKRPKDGLTVVFHSVFLIYPPRDQIVRIMKLIRDAGRAATEANPLAWLSYEAEVLFGGPKNSPKMNARLQTWPGGAPEILAQSDGHVTRVTAFET